MASSDKKGDARKGVKEDQFYPIEVRDYIVPLLHLQIGLGNDIFSSLLDWINHDIEKNRSHTGFTFGN
jgi:hypothetical protein